MRIVKLGGSLLAGKALTSCLDQLNQLSGQTVIVPGGGVFADQVRTIQQEFGFADVYAHHMALLAMQQTAVLIKALKPSFHWFNELKTDWQGQAIWQPDITELDQAGIAASWSITYDSLAAWLAEQQQAEALILVKSAKIPANASLAELQQQGIVDAAFCHFAEKLSCPIHIIHKDHLLELI